MNEQHIVLSLGTQKNPNTNLGNPIRREEKERRERQQIIMTILAAAAVPAALQGAQAGLNELFSSVFEGNDGAISAFTGGVATTQAIISMYQILLAYFIVTSQQKTQKYNVVKHEDPNAKIELTHEGDVTIATNKGSIFLDADSTRAASPRFLLDGSGVVTGRVKMVTENASLLVQEDGLIEINSSGAGQDIVIDPGSDKVVVAGSFFSKGPKGVTIAKNLKVLP